MSDIPNTEYITVNENDIFVGGKPAIHYCGQKILYPESIKNKFEKIQQQYPNIKELRFLASETGGKYYGSGKPVAKHGSNGWACFEFIDGFVSPWVLVISGENYTMDYTVGHGPNDYLNNCCRHKDVFLQPVLGPYRDIYIKVNLQNTTEALYNVNGYNIRLIVEKVAPKGR
jgi:hypothetical protein